MEFNEYEKVIAKDVASNKYHRDKKLVKIVFLVVSALFLTIYYFGFHSDIIDNFKTVLESYRKAIITDDFSFKVLIFSFNRIIAFMFFLFFLVIFLIFAFFSYDIMSRNRVIEHFQRKALKSEGKNDNNNAPESEYK